MNEVTLWEEDVIIPTYDVYEANKSPMFLENRVYQGSSGKIYPYPAIEKISDVKKDKSYHAVFLENRYLKIMILPELGGRIQRAFDKTNGYDFVYYNHVIKPALVGLCGPWISGGIEFNWPQHHRPTTFMPVDYILLDNEDGSKTCRVSDIDQMYGTKGEASYTLYPDIAYIEIKGQLYNPTPTPQTFLWWANPAVPVNDHTQSIFPPDVRAVMDHGKRDVSRFPIATGVYYKYDYSDGVDISRYKNILVPTSYMAQKSDFDFVGGYDYNREAGILHIADHHISPGKKQWTWGSGDFGKAWDRNLTDEDGPYIELMTGMFTDNQPDFSWLKPMEEKTFTQYFMPYKAVGKVKNASVDAVINLEIESSHAHITAYATRRFENARIHLTYDGKEIFDEQAVLSPVDIYKKECPLLKVLGSEFDETKLTLFVYDTDRLLVSYSPLKKEIPKLPKPAAAAADPGDIMTNEELYLTGLHIEQYRHATYRPDPYYLEGLKRDPKDVRINNAYGSLLFNRGLFEESEKYFLTAIERLTVKNPNPYHSESYYKLGLSLRFQGKIDEAFDAFYKATWSSEQQEAGFYYLSCIETGRNRFESALSFAQKALVKNAHNVKARGLYAYLLRKTNKMEEAKEFIAQSLLLDPFDYVSLLECSRLGNDNAKILERFGKVCCNRPENYLKIARDYAEFCAYQEAIEALAMCKDEYPMLFYYRAYYQNLLGLDFVYNLEAAEHCKRDYCFPNKSEDILVLRFAVLQSQNCGSALYYLGNLFYDKYQYESAAGYWERSLALGEKFPITYRNLALAYYNKLDKKECAKEFMEKALLSEPTNAGFFLELDQLYKKLNVCVARRLGNYEKSKGLFMQRDDLMIEYAALLNLSGRYEQAYSFIKENRFHPWEGGEGKVTTQYKIALVELARIELARSNWEKATEFLRQALNYPDNLGEGKLEGTKDNDIYYYLGIAAKNSGDEKAARDCFLKGSLGDDELAGVMYYNDQPADMIYFRAVCLGMLGDTTGEKSGFNRLIDYGQHHFYDQVKIEYFAVSLPDFLIFEEDLDKKNTAHCYYLIGLGNMGLGNKKEAADAFRHAIEIEPTHLNAIRYLNGL